MHVCRLYAHTNTGFSDNINSSYLGRILFCFSKLIIITLIITKMHKTLKLQIAFTYINCCGIKQLIEFIELNH